MELRKLKAEKDSIMPTVLFALLFFLSDQVVSTLGYDSLYRNLIIMPVILIWSYVSLERRLRKYYVWIILTTLAIATVSELLFHAGDRHYTFNQITFRYLIYSTIFMAGSFVVQNRSKD
ncbi:hypothetical protein ACFO9Q_21715 [Paenibacillus sp. GCM10023252]|uniref:hypothetical protein n=1 Tax=Paenibacillus sp. GCM10023252 TaxID=3252649 RepID=UPI003623D9F3